MNNGPFISICILSYNRTDTLLRLLKTVETEYVTDIEIIICEDCSPNQKEIRQLVNNFKSETSYSIKYHENKFNLGFDGTFNQLVRYANGCWLIFMGDDDEFVPGALDEVYKFLKNNGQLGYVMKSHYLILEDGSRELFRYYKGTKIFSAGVNTYISLFRKSVFIAGFTIRRECAIPYLTNRFDGTMLIQLYILAEVVMKYPSAYFDVPFTQQYASHAHNEKDVMFDRENKQFIPRKPNLDISLKFLKSFSDITGYIDSKYRINSSQIIKRDQSKYFYPSLAIYRDEGLPFFINYVRELNKLNFNCTLYYYIYVLLLILFGRPFCDWGIRFIKKVFGYTPHL